MFTDGVPDYCDYGMTSAAVALAKEQMEKARNAGIHTFGFGIDVTSPDTLISLFKEGWVNLQYGQSPSHLAAIIMDKLKEAFK